MKINTISATVCLLMLFSNTSLRPAAVEGFNYPDKYTLGKSEVTLRGYGLLRYMFVIKAYTGAFYLKEGTPSDKALSSVPRILELHYLQKISAEDFKYATTQVIKKNLSSQQFIRIKKELDQMNNLFKDVIPGDSYKASYIPGRGTRLALNGRTLGTVKGTLFSYAFFSIWIGKNPIDREFRNRLLGR